MIKRYPKFGGAMFLLAAEPPTRSCAPPSNDGYWYFATCLTTPHCARPTSLAPRAQPA